MRLTSLWQRMKKQVNLPALTTAHQFASTGQPSASSLLLPEFRQTTLNRHLGLPLRDIQTRVDSLWRRQVRLQGQGETVAAVASLGAVGGSRSISNIANTSIEIIDMEDGQPSSDVEAVSVSKGECTSFAMSLSSLTICDPCQGTKRRVVASSDEDEAGQNGHADAVKPPRKVAKSRTASPKPDRTNGSTKTDVASSSKTGQSRLRYSKLSPTTRY